MATLHEGPTIRFRTKQEYVHQSLREAILQGELAPGQRLVIDEIARRLEVSAIPIREALQLLQSEGLVQIAPHVGATVAPISEASIDEAFAILEGLETVAVRGLVARMTDGGQAEIDAFVRQMDEAVERGDHEAWARLNAQFHRRIGELAGMPLLREMTDRVLSHWERLRRFYFKGVLVHRVQQAQGEHRELLQALVARDADAAERVIRHHNRAALAAYKRFLGGPRPETP